MPLLLKEVILHFKNMKNQNNVVEEDAAAAENRVKRKENRVKKEENLAEREEELAVAEEDKEEVLQPAMDHHLPVVKNLGLPHH
jgi:hypothetical protein